ncbi:MAG: hypothetical protein HC831_09615 [Chloroflexia bacterium]|nr:hypothetical protein [Chloroflexia bacterium]
MKIFLFLVSTAFIMLFLSCSGGNNSNDGQDSIDLENADTGVVFIDESDEVIYFVSSPGEIIEVLNEADLKYKPRLINDFAKYENYVVQSSQAINLGIYTADLGYCTYYDELSSAANLFFAIQDLSNKLEVSYLLNNIHHSRVKRNLHNADSVRSLAKEYNKMIYSHFVENNKKGMLALISTGGLVESLYLALNSIDKVDPESAIAKAIAEQKFSFEVLRDFVYQQKGNKLVEGINDDIAKLDAVFETITPKKDTKTNVAKNNGKIVIGGSNNLTIDQAQFEKLKIVVSEVRNRYIEL